MKNCWHRRRAGIAMIFLLSLTGLANASKLEDIAYGSDPAQRMDVYLPDQASSQRPLLVMVHGGAWRFGDKKNRAVVKNKIQRWVEQGWVLVSLNYRMLPDTPPDQQAKDIASALAEVQKLAPQWQADPKQMVLMGHSAGAQLVAIIATNPALTSAYPKLHWQGAILLDSAALDITQIMEKRHPKLYDRAFGDEPEYWRQNSATHHLHAKVKPILLVCSNRRSDSCNQAESFSAKGKALGVATTVLPQNLSHLAINSKLGSEGEYTEAVEKFMYQLTHFKKQP